MFKLDPTVYYVVLGCGCLENKHYIYSSTTYAPIPTIQCINTLLECTFNHPVLNKHSHVKIPAVSTANPFYYIVV